MSAPPPQPPFGYGAYEPPASSVSRPTVILWYRAYSGAVALCTGGAAVYALFDPRSTGPAYENFVLVAGILALLHGVGAAVPFKPWGWTYAFVLTLLGVCSCLLPFALGIALCWREPTTKAAFQRF